MILYQGRGIKIAELWFSDFSENPSDEASFDIAYIYQYPQSLDSISGKKFYTLVIDLRKTLTEIEAGLSKNTKYEIKRAEEKDGLKSSFIKTPNEHDIKNFQEYFSSFAAQKGLGSVGINRIKGIAAANSLILTNCRNAAGEILCWHAYVARNKRIRLLYSASLRSNSEAAKADRALIGRANRWLHWQDIVLSRESGFDVYDMGGWHPTPPNQTIEGINKFKEGFSQVREESLDGVFIRTLRGHLYLLAKRIMG